MLTIVLFDFSKFLKGSEDTMQRDDIVVMNMSAETVWRDYMAEHVYNDKYSKNKFAEFYVTLAYDYALQVDYTADTAHHLVVFEILEGKAHMSPEFVLLNDPMVTDLLFHYALFLLQHQPEKLIGVYGDVANNLPVSRSFGGDNENMHALWLKDPEFVERMILTRTLSSYETYCDMIENYEKSLKLSKLDKSYFESQGWDTAELDKGDVVIRENIERGEFIVNLIEILVDSGVKVYSPAELEGFVKSYLGGLVKRNEEYLNPFVVGSRKREVLPGELQIQAHMKSMTGEDWVFPR